MRSPHNIYWVGETRERLEKLWSAGYSARLIAAEFETTRNAILGAVHRLKLPKRKVAVSAERAVYKRPKSKPRHRALRSFKFKPPVCEPIEVPIPDTALRVSLLDRKDHQCCYPIDGMIYCGADKQAGSSYCPWHHRRVWVTPIKKKRQAQEQRVRSFSDYEVNA